MDLNTGTVALDSPENLSQQAAFSFRDRQTAQYVDLRPINRACDLCYRHKSRCIRLEFDFNSSQGCQRCALLNRPCVYSARRPRRQQQKSTTSCNDTADKRITTLQAQVSQLQTLISGPRATVPAQTISKQATTAGEESRKLASGAVNTEDVDTIEITHQSIDNGHHSRRRESMSARRRMSGAIHQNLENYADVIDRGVLTMAQATTLFNTFNLSIKNNIPLFAIEDWQTASVMRTTKPTLFLTILASTASLLDGMLYRTLRPEATRRISEMCLGKPDQSIEHIQALLCWSVYGLDPDRPSAFHPKYYTHLAVIMATDMNLDRHKSCPWDRFLSGGNLALHSSSFLPESAQRHRTEHLRVVMDERVTYLATYFACVR
jgi:hypothetical protein